MTDALAKSVWDRLGIAALFGLAYFVVWPVWDHYLVLSNISGPVASNGLMFIAVLAALLSLYIIRGKPKKRLSQSLLLLLVFSWTGLYIFSYQFYQWMSVALGYYDDPPLLVAQTEGSEPYHFNDLLLSIAIPKSWHPQKLMPLGAVYFDRREKDASSAQLRPKCFHNSKSVLASMVQQYSRKQQSQGRQVAKQCYRRGDSVACILTHQSKQGEHTVWRTRWFSVNPQTRQAVELDFLVFEHSPALEQEVMGIIASAQLDTSKAELPACVQIVDWI